MNLSKQEISILKHVEKTPAVLIEPQFKSIVSNLVKLKYLNILWTTPLATLELTEKTYQYFREQTLKSIL